MTGNFNDIIFSITVIIFLSNYLKNVLYQIQNGILFK